MMTPKSRLGACAIAAFILGVALGHVVFHHQPERNINQLQGVIVPVLSLDVYDAEGRLVKSIVKVGDPPTLNFIKILLHIFWNQEENKEIHNRTVVAMDGSSYTVGEGGHSVYYGTVAGVAVVSAKVILGNGTTPFSIDQYALSGTWTQDVPVHYYAAYYNSTHMWTLYEATWTNNLGADKDVTEVGLAIYWYYSGTVAKWFLIFRDVLSNPVTVPDGGALVVRYYIYVRYG